MAKTSMKIKQQRKAKFSTREYNRCKICGIAIGILPIRDMPVPPIYFLELIVSYI